MAEFSARTLIRVSRSKNVPVHSLMPEMRVHGSIVSLTSHCVTANEETIADSRVKLNCSVITGRRCVAAYTTFPLTWFTPRFSRTTENRKYTEKKPYSLFQSKRKPSAAFCMHMHVAFRRQK